MFPFFQWAAALDEATTVQNPVFMVFYFINKNKHGCFGYHVYIFCNLYFV